MQFVFDKGFYKVARITGPMHNFLALRLADGAVGDIDLTPLGPEGNNPGGVSSESVLAQVKSGLELVNSELNRQYSISEIQFIPSDSVSNSVYELLTIELIRKIDRGWDE